MLNGVKKLIIACSLPIIAHATGMAVSLNNLYLQNNTSQSMTIQIENLTESANKLVVPAKSICKINQSLMFLPFAEESDNFAIMVKSSNMVNPIVIDNFGLLALASDSAIKAPYSGKVKQYSLFGFCGNKLGQYKFLNVIPHTNESDAPNFELANCKTTSNFVYFINDKYIRVKNKPKALDFARVANICKSAESQ
ncbi:MAG: hypothetical protein RLZZ293_167 [Pseudomonadota bacterium]|jgi:hypothetical protein